MTIKELSQLYWLHREIEDMQRRLDETESRAQSPSGPNLSGMPSGGAGSSKVESGAIECASLRSSIEQAQQRYIAEQTKLLKYIDSIPDSRTRQIFRARFFDYESWAEVAQIIGKGATASSVRKACQRYVQDGAIIY
jgi:hypothetical protein